VWHRDWARPRPELARAFLVGQFFPVLLAVSATVSFAIFAMVSIGHDFVAHSAGDDDRGLTGLSPQEISGLRGARTAGARRLATVPLVE
jgi:hypothetical protein